MTLSFLLLPPFLLLMAMVASLAEGGTWLSFNQNTGGLDRLSALRGKSIADAVNSGELITEGEQLAGLLRMCSERAKRSLLDNSQRHNMDELCSALFQMAKEERRRRKRKMGARHRTAAGRTAAAFVPIGPDDEQLLWW